MCCEGVNLGRFGKICWLVVRKLLCIIADVLTVLSDFYPAVHCLCVLLTALSVFKLQIGCSKFIYLFDILSLGAPCFDEGLQDILESGDILKV